MNYNRRVQFQDCDPAGIAFFSRFFDYSHEALVKFLEDKGLPLADWFENENLAIPLVQATADYRKPARLHDWLDLKVKVVHTGHTSVQFETTIERKSKTNLLVAIVKTTHVFVDKRTSEKTEIPRGFRDILTK